MDKSGKRIILFILILFIFITTTGCSSKNKSKITFNPQDPFSIEQFQSEMKAKKITFKIEDVESHIFPTTSKQMKIGKESLIIYLFNSNEQMEKEAKCISKDGNQYSGDSGTSYFCYFSSYPNFYKRGSIIVLYVGSKGKILSSLEDILGERFAGS